MFSTGSPSHELERSDGQDYRPLPSPNLPVLVCSLMEPSRGWTSTTTRMLGGLVNEWAVVSATLDSLVQRRYRP